MAGLIALFIIAVFFTIGAWGFKGIQNRFGTNNPASKTYILLFLISAAAVGLVTSTLSVYSFKDQQINGFDFYLRHFMYVLLMISIAFFVSRIVSLTAIERIGTYASKAIVASLPFVIIYLFILIDWLVEIFNVQLHS